MPMPINICVAVIFLMVSLAVPPFVIAADMTQSLPVATKWLLDAAGDTGRAAIRSVYLIVCPDPFNKGTGFVLRGGSLITNEHVVRGCPADKLRVVSSDGKEISIERVVVDTRRDLALLSAKPQLPGGLRLGLDEPPKVGTVVSTWGYPLAWWGPAPLLTVGHLSGFGAHLISQTDKVPTKRLVVNGAFNPGNSGGPLFEGQNDRVIGVVVSKHAPITPFLQSALDALAANPSGVVFTATDDKGNTKTFVESQVVAELLKYFRELTQVVIGEAVAGSELRAFLKENKIPVPE